MRFFEAGNASISRWTACWQAVIPLASAGLGRFSQAVPPAGSPG